MGNNADKWVLAVSRTRILVRGRAGCENGKRVPPGCDHSLAPVPLTRGPYGQLRPQQNAEHGGHAADAILARTMRLTTQGDKTHNHPCLPPFRCSIGSAINLISQGRHRHQREGRTSPRSKPGFTSSRGCGQLRRIFGTIWVFCGSRYWAELRAILVRIARRSSHAVWDPCLAVNKTSTPPPLV